MKSTRFTVLESECCDQALHFKLIDFSYNSNVNNQIEKIKIKNEKFLDLVKNTDTSVNIEFKDLRKSMMIVFTVHWHQSIVTNTQIW